MIVILTAAYKKHCTFKNFSEVATFIMDFEIMSQPDDDPRVDKPDWFFKHYDCDQVQSLYESMAPSLAKDRLANAYHQRLPALEICIGQYDNPQFVTVTDEVNVDDQRKSWCFEYYKAKDYFLIETFDLAEFEGDAFRSLKQSLPFLEWLCDQDGLAKAYPYGIYIRAPYPLAGRSIIPIVNEWQERLKKGEVI